MKIKYSFSQEKSDKLLKERGFSFIDIISAIAQGNLLDELENPKYKNQKILVVMLKNYVCAVAVVVEKENNYFLKTAYLSKKLNKRYKR